jgi:hypothetical protein
MKTWQPLLLILAIASLVFFAQSCDDEKAQPGASSFTITTSSLPDAVLGREYLVTLESSGGVEPCTWELSAGTMPEGLALAGHGVISGMPSKAGISEFTIRAADAEDATATRAFTMTTHDEAPESLMFEVFTPTGVRAGTFDLFYRMRGPEGAVVSVTVEYSLNGIKFFPAAAAAESPPLEDLAVKDVWENHVFQWNTIDDINAAREESVVVRMTASGDLGGTASTKPFVVDNTQSTEGIVRFFGTVICSDHVVYVLDRTGSMSYPYNHPVTDLDGSIIEKPSKIQALVIELKKSIMGLSPGTKFNVVFFAHRWGRKWGCGHYVYTPAPGPEPASHWDPPDSDPDTVQWMDKAMPASVANVAVAFEWIDENAVPNGCTCISDGAKQGLVHDPDIDALILLSDGFPQTFQQTIYYADHGYADIREYCINRTKEEIRAANENVGVPIHTFYITYSSGSTELNELTRQLMQNIAKEHDGTFTEVDN